MPKWWIRLFRHGTAHGAGVSADATLAAEEFLRPTLSDFPLSDPAALAKAKALLERALTPEQRADLFARGYFRVKGRKFNYRIREAHSANVDALDASERVVSRYCAHPVGRVPVYDVMLAQKLWIETDENMFLHEAAPYPVHLSERRCPL